MNETIELSLNGITDVPAGKIAAVVTLLEMTERPASIEAPERADLALARIEAPTVAWYRDLYHRIGAEWLWFSRLRLADADLAAILEDPGTEVFALMRSGRAEGLLELDRSDPLNVELAFFGVTPALVGTGAGRWLMAEALRIGWDFAPRRLWVHTCTLDHPRALGFYMKWGFRPYARAIEVADDPRLDGTLSRQSGAHVPVI